MSYREKENLIYIVFLWFLANGVEKSWSEEGNYISTPDHKKGTFKSPKYPDRYPEKTIILIKFLAQENERVKIKFEDFDVHGLWPG